MMEPFPDEGTLDDQRNHDNHRSLTGGGFAHALAQARGWRRVYWDMDELGVRLSRDVLLSLERTLDEDFEEKGPWKLSIEFTPSAIDHDPNKLGKLLAAALLRVADEVAGQTPE
jgi:hypothetical protein